MKTLVVDDDFTSRLLLQSLLSRYGECHTALNAYEAVDAFRMATNQQAGYDLVCMDILMPGPHGPDAVRSLRSMEQERGIVHEHCAKIIMTTSSTSVHTVSQSFYSLCDAYLTKPIDAAKLLETLRSYRLIT